MFRKTLCVPLVLAFAMQAAGQSTPPPRFREGQVVRNRAEQQLWIDRKAAWEAAQAEKDNTLYLTEQQVRELRLEKKVVSVDGFDREILDVEAVDPNALRIRPLRQGATAIDVVDEDGNSRHYAVLIAGDTRQIELILRRHFPDAKITVDEVQDAVILSGEVADPVQIEQAVEVAEQFYPRVLNWLKAASGAELQRGNQPAATGQPAPADAEPATADAPAPKPADDSSPDEDADLRQVISEIRSLRTVIQDVRSDVMKLRVALQLQEQTEVENVTPPEGFQSATETIQIPASQSWLFDRGRSIARLAIADPSILDVVQYSPKQVGFVGFKPGKTTVSIWFDNESQPVMMTVEVRPPSADGWADARRRADNQAHEEIERALDEPVEVHLSDAPLRDVLQQLAKSAAINVVVDARALEDEGFTVDHAVTLDVKGVTLRSALNLLIADLGLTWVIEDEVLKITNQFRAAGGLTVKTYRISELPGSGTDQARRLEQVKELIMATITPDSWSEIGGPGHIAAVAGGRSLVIRQTEDVHTQILILLRTLHPLMTTRKQDTRSPVSSSEPWDPQRLPVRTVDRLQMEDLLGRRRTPVVVLPGRRSHLSVTQQPPPELNVPNLPPDLTFRRATGKPLAVASGSGNPKGVNKAVNNLPRVDAKGGVYIENARPAYTVKTEVRNYSPSSQLLQKFRADGNFDADAAKKLGEHIRQSINPGSWDADSVQVTTDKSGSIQLVITHTPGTHDRVRRLLERLEAEERPKQPDKTPDSGQAWTDPSAENGKVAAMRDRLGIKFAESVSDEIKATSRTYRGGLLISEVGRNSPAAAVGIQKGDILVGIHNWETLTSENVDFALQQINDGKVQSPLKFYVVRNGETMTGRIILPGRPD